MNSYGMGSTGEEVSGYLESKYGYSLIQFENTIQVIQTHFKLLDKKRGTREVARTIEYLESSKTELVMKIDEFITKSKSWKWIQSSHPNRGIETEEDKAGFIESEFQLSSYFSFVDERISSLRKVIRILGDVNLYTDRRRKKIQPQTILVLVWIYALVMKGASNRKSFSEARTLLRWFSRNRSELLRETFGPQIRLTLDTIRRNYERYFIKPNHGRGVFRELTESLYSDCFLDYD